MRLSCSSGGDQKVASVKEYLEISDQNVIKGLAHPLRVQILGILETRAASPNELAQELGVPLGNVSYHTRELLRFGLVELVKKTPRRGAIEHYYKATKQPQITEAGWAATPRVVKDSMVRSALEQISDFVNAAAIEGGFNHDESHLNRIQLTVDERGWQEVSQKLTQLLAALPKIEEASRKRLERAGHEGERDMTVVTMGFETAEPMLARRRKRAKPARRTQPRARTK
jgi:DNA-binding transcriptional ArsR family regulator